jgi:hypothetical protein
MEKEVKVHKNLLELQKEYGKKFEKFKKSGIPTGKVIKTKNFRPSRPKTAGHPG